MTMTSSSTDPLGLIASLNVRAAAEMAKVGHYSSDPTVVNHCVFCGSGALTARSDGGVDCGVCQRSFTVMEQPIYTNMPSGEQGAAVRTTPNDPLMAEDAFDPGQEDADVPPADGEAEAPPAAPDEQQDGGTPPAFLALRARSGAALEEDDFVLHHAIRAVRGS